MWSPSGCLAKSLANFLRISSPSLPDWLHLPAGEVSATLPTALGFHLRGQLCDKADPAHSLSCAFAVIKCSSGTNKCFSLPLDIKSLEEIEPIEPATFRELVWALRK